MAASRKIDRSLIVALMVAIFARVGVFAGTIVWPIPNENGTAVSPLLPPAFYDYQFYLESMRRYLLEPETVVSVFVQSYGGVAAQLPDIISGPFYPLLILVTGFAGGNYLPLALIYLVLGCAVAAAWLVWLRQRGLGAMWLLLFAVLPNPIWFMLVISSDLLFAVEFGAFFLAYFASRRTRATTLTWTVALIAMVLTRPNSFSVLLFIAADTAWSFYRTRRIEWQRMVVSMVLVLLGGLFLYPYFVLEMSKAAHSLEYFGHTPNEYLRGLSIPGLPQWIGTPLSWMALFCAKLLYFTGLRPSYGQTAEILVLARGAPGLVLLPGLVMLLFAAPGRQRVLVILYFLPFLLGPSQDRYYLAIYPLFFLYGARFWNGAWVIVVKWARNSFRASAHHERT